MLVRVRGTATKIDKWTYKLDLALPVLYFDDNNYNISVRMVMLDCSFTHGIPTDQYWSLHSTAIDKSALNPRQELLTFVSNYKQASGYNFVYYEPHIKRDYKLQIPSFHTSEFSLTTLKQNAALEINFVEILFEFSRYARI